MKHPVHIYNELKEIGPFLAELEKDNVFSVPVNYFSGLDSVILKGVKQAQSSVLPLSETPFTIPHGYFENLPGNILQKVKATDTDDAHAELQQLSPLLHSMQGERVFLAPTGYFESFPDTILTVLKPQAKVVTMKKRNMVWNCAAAAVITGIMAVSAVWTSNTPVRQASATAQNQAVPLKDALQYKNEQQLIKGISDLSDAEIINYLENTGSNIDDEALAAGIPDKDLPDEKDYLANDNTLQIFLRKTGSKNNQN